MQDATDKLLCLLTLTIPVLGIVLALTTRLAHPVCGRAWCERFFLASLIATGMLTIASILSGCQSWLSCCTTIALMSIAATFDFRAHKIEAPL